MKKWLPVIIIFTLVILEVNFYNNSMQETDVNWENGDSIFTIYFKLIQMDTEGAMGMSNSNSFQ